MKLQKGTYTTAEYKRLERLCSTSYSTQFRHGADCVLLTLLYPSSDGDELCALLMFAKRKKHSRSVECLDCVVGLGSRSAQIAVQRAMMSEEWQARFPK